MQFIDLIMGVINYKLRGENKVIVKIKLIEKIEIYCGVFIICLIVKVVDKFNLFFIDLKQ